VTRGFPPPRWPGGAARTAVSTCGPTTQDTPAPSAMWSAATARTASADRRSCSAARRAWHGRLGLKHARRQRNEYDRSMFSPVRASVPLAVFGLTILACRADDGSHADAFCEREISEFNSLLRLCKPERARYWQQRYQQTVERYNSEAKKLQQEYDSLKGQIENVGAFLSYNYLNRINEVRLVDNTAPVEDLGRELLRDRAAVRLSPALLDIDEKFQTFKTRKRPASWKRPHRLRRSTSSSRRQMHSRPSLVKRSSTRCMTGKRQ
jgi:hypothetical protein